MIMIMIIIIIYIPNQKILNLCKTIHPLTIIKIKSYIKIYYKSININQKLILIYNSNVNKINLSTLVYTLNYNLNMMIEYLSYINQKQIDVSY